MIFKRVPFPLKKKVAYIAALLTVLSFFVYVPAAYLQAQVLLANMLYERSGFALREFMADKPDILSDAFDEESGGYAVGARGYIFAVSPRGIILSKHPNGAETLTEENFEPDVQKKLLSSDFQQTASHRGGTRYVTVLQYGPNRIFSIVREDDFLHLLNPLIGFTLVVGLAFGTIFAVLIVFFVRGIAGPITELAAAARDMMHKRKFDPVLIATGDEVEMLADEFNAMGREIRGYEQDLEKKIDDRVREIKDLNAHLTSALEEAKKADKELIRLNAAKSSFVSLVTHQLKTPITSLKWYAEILSRARDKLPDELREPVRHIEAANENMAELVNNILNVTRVETGTISVNVRSVQIKDLLEKILEVVKPIAEKRSLHIALEAPEEVPAICDPELLNIIVTNLLTNAIRYTPDNGKVLITLAKKAKSFIISVSDTGIGIPVAAQKSIFVKRFFRAKNAVKKEPQGAGLGLYMTKSIADMLGGEISFKSKENYGTTFTVQLPSAPATLPS